MTRFSSDRAQDSATILCRAGRGSVALRPSQGCVKAEYPTFGNFQNKLLITTFKIKLQTPALEFY